MQLRFMFFSYLCARVQPGFGEQYTVAFTVSIYVETDRICFFFGAKSSKYGRLFSFFFRPSTTLSGKTIEVHQLSVIDQLNSNVSLVHTHRPTQVNYNVDTHCMFV